MTKKISFNGKPLGGFAGLAAVLLALGLVFAFAGCKDDDSDDGDDGGAFDSALVGTWKGNTRTITIKAQNDFAFGSVYDQSLCTLSASGGIITLKPKINGAFSEGSFKYAIEENTLTLSEGTGLDDGAAAFNGTYTKQ